MQRLMKIWPGVAVMLGGLFVVATTQAAARPTAPLYQVTGSAMPITDPAQYRSTTALNNGGLSVSNPTYYVVHGEQHNGQWQYPFSVTVSGATVVTIPLGQNQTQHTELVEVGVPTPALLQWASPSHGTSSRSVVAPPASR